MKKSILLLFALTIYSGIQAQGVFKIGGNIGVGVSDAGDIADFSLGADAYYMFEKVDAVLNFGPTIGFQNFFTDFSDAKDALFLPVGVAGRVKVLGTLDVGVDVGYALGLTDYLDGGFYFRPTAGLDLFNTVELYLTYMQIYDAATWGNVAVGLLIEL